MKEATAQCECKRCVCGDTYPNDSIQFLHSDLLGALNRRCNLLLMLQHINANTSCTFPSPYIVTQKSYLYLLQSADLKQMYAQSEWFNQIKAV